MKMEISREDGEQDLAFLTIFAVAKDQL